MARRYSDASYENVQLDSFVAHACSPVPDDPSFRGIRIAAPNEVYFTPGEPDSRSGAFATIPVCGVSVFEPGQTRQADDAPSSIVFVAVDTETHEAFSGVPYAPFNLTPGPRPPGPAGIAGRERSVGSIRSYFNPNLARILKLPERAASYDVYATIGSYKSNVVRIRVAVMK